jgi:uncharacterized protein
VARFFGVGRQDQIFQSLETKMMIRWCAVLGVFAALSLTSAALAEPEQAGTYTSSQATISPPSTTPTPEAVTGKKGNASSNVTASKSKAKPSSKATAAQRSASPSAKATADKPKANASSQVATSKSKAKPSSTTIAGQPKAASTRKLAAGASSAHSVSIALTGTKPAANPAAKSSVANANAALMTKPHRIVIQVDQNDPAVMNLALNNATNVIEYYRAKQQDVQVDLVTYGPGLHMLRDDTSPVKDRLKQLKDSAFPSTVQLSACANTKENMEKKEGKPISIVSDAVLVPSGVVHLMELQENGWSYVRP